MCCFEPTTDKRRESVDNRTNTSDSKVDQLNYDYLAIPFRHSILQIEHSVYMRYTLYFMSQKEKNETGNRH